MYFTCMCTFGLDFTSAVTMSFLGIDLTPKFDVPSINPLPCAAAQYKRMIVRYTYPSRFDNTQMCLDVYTGSQHYQFSKGLRHC